MDTPLLWHIPLSHYSEKLRWALDYKCIAHRRRVLGPDYLIRVSPSPLICLGEGDHETTAIHKPNCRNCFYWRSLALSVL